MRPESRSLAKIWIAALAAVAVLLFFINQRGSSYVHHSPAKEGPIVAFGDSLTAGSGASSPEKSYPAQLEALIGRKVINAGRPGDTTYEGLARVQAEAIAHNPAAVVITLGGNDEIRRMPNETTAMNFAKTVDALHQAGIMVAFVDIDPPAGGWRFKLLKKQNGEMGVLRIEGVMKGFWGNRALMADTIHPNDEGYKLFAERVAAALKPHLK